jgi:hypothetical protein
LAYAKLTQHIYVVVIMLSPSKGSDLYHYNKPEQRNTDKSRTSEVDYFLKIYDADLWYTLTHGVIWLCQPML